MPVDHAVRIHFLVIVLFCPQSLVAERARTVDHSTAVFAGGHCHVRLLQHVRPAAVRAGLRFRSGLNAWGNICLLPDFLPGF